MSKVWIGIGGGIGAGLAFAALSVPLQYIKNDDYRKRSYFAFFLLMAIVVPIVSELINVPDAKYVTIITASYII